MWITRIAVANPVFATMVMAALCVLGSFAYGRLGVEQMPDVSLPGVTVAVAYPGASPEAVEREISRPLEDALNTVAGVRRITSRSMEGRSETEVEFGVGTDMARAVQELRDHVAAAQPAFPREAKAPSVARLDNENAQPAVVLALLSPNRDARELSMLAERTVGKRLQRVDGVARVDMAGIAAREVRVEIDPLRLRAHGITPSEVAEALRQANSDEPLGRLSNVTDDALVRMQGRVHEPRRFADVVVARRGALALTLGELATIVETDREPDSIARINGQRAVSFNIHKQQDANLVATGEAVKASMDELRKMLPADVELRLIHASSDFVKRSLAGLQHTLIEGALLTVAIVFLFLHSWRSTLITGLALPIAVISSFIAVHAFGYTLNFMTMMALSLCIGLLIDDAIVVRENIVRHLGMGKDHHTAAREGTDEIGLAVMATTFAICAVFVPVAFMGGVVGQFFRPFGITVVAAVLVSLFVSFTLDPMLSSVWRDPPAQHVRQWPVVRHLIRFTDRGLALLQAAYRRLIGWAFSGHRYPLLPIPVYGHPFNAHGQRQRLRPRRWRLATVTPRGVVVLAGAASLAVALALAPMVGTEFIPQTDQGFTQLSIRLPVGASLARSDAKARQVEALVASVPEVRTIAASVSRGQATLDIELVPRAQRTRTQAEVEDAVRDAVARVAGIDTSVGFGRPIEVAVLGDDPAILGGITAELARKLEEIPGIVDVELSVKPGPATHAVKLKPMAERELGLSAQQVASSLRAYVGGEVATHWSAPDGRQVEVVLRLPEAQRERVDQMRLLPVAFSKDGKAITLDSAATIEPVVNPAVIHRQNLQRREIVSAGTRDRPTGDVGADVHALVNATTLPPGYSFDIGGATREQDDAFAAVPVAMALALVFLYIVLASQFGSFLQPLAILCSLPLALIGVMLALLLWRSTLNVFSMIGLVMLMGLVTKNAILLVDFANQARRAGAGVADALLQAGTIRMRPIVMTTAAMVFGMLPLALALNDGGEIQAPMGRAIIGGVITSTLLTLVVVPVAYSYLDDLGEWFSRRFRRGAAGAVPAHRPGFMPADK